jgi:hypothetical protein
MIQKPESLHASGEGIIHQLEHMLASPDFNVRAQLIAFLKFVVNRKLEGIKGYTIATEVFGHRSDFDQGIDPIVSIQATLTCGRPTS